MLDNILYQIWFYNFGTITTSFFSMGSNIYTIIYL